MAPNIELTRRDVQIAADDQRVSGIPPRHVGGQTPEEVQLMGELAIDLRIWLIPAGWRVKVVDIDASDARRNASGMAFTADVEGPRGLKWQRGGDSHPMPSLLAHNLQVRISCRDEGVGWKGGRLAFYFLQTQDVRLLLPGET
jgi:hypothetical protein